MVKTPHSHLQGAQVPFLVGELRSHMPHSPKKGQLRKNSLTLFHNIILKLLSLQESNFLKFVSVSVCVWATKSQSCSDSCDPMDCSPPGSSVHGIFQARILKWVVISFSRRSSQPRDQTRISYIGWQILSPWATWEPTFRLLTFSATGKAAFCFASPCSVIVPCCWIN